MRVGKPHHLVPCKSNINTLRRNAPFGDIPDDKTKYWILADKVFIRPDKRYLDSYSESTAGFFEPREALKGDIPRSLFYFFTVYGHTITKKNSSFFTSMLPDLCRWHRSDKVDSTEYKKSIAIARIQSNINPFVFDPSLAERCYCYAYPTTPAKSFSVNIYPNPS
jgi:endonuclease I